PTAMAAVTAVTSQWCTKRCWTFYSPVLPCDPSWRPFSPDRRRATSWRRPCNSGPEAIRGLGSYFGGGRCGGYLGSPGKR
ncbi:Hypothetical protein (Fragment), partial [Durusdinium trenchii]